MACYLTPDAGLEHPSHYGAEMVMVNINPLAAKPLLRQGDTHARPNLFGV